MRWKPAFRITILILICSVSTLVRIFSVIRYESIIHEFDPWFNYRATKFLVNHDFKEFWNFFDSESWYPLGRNVGATVYPGLMVIFFSYSVHFRIHLHCTSQIRDSSWYQEYLCLFGSSFCFILFDCCIFAYNWSDKKARCRLIGRIVYRTCSKLHVKIGCRFLW